MQSPWPISLPAELQALDIAPKIRIEPEAIAAASTDFGGFVTSRPSGVLYPESERDVARLVRFAFESDARITVAARGAGGSVNGQAFALEDGVVVRMRSLADRARETRIRVWNSDDAAELGPYADVGGEQLWSEVVKETLKHGLSPRVLVDYLEITVGGTLSVGGLGGQSFKHGPLVANVYELDVITGKGEIVTCSPSLNSELFYAVLGGLGQFGIIIRARIPLFPAPTKARWTALIYSDFKAYRRDIEYLSSLDGSSEKKGCDYVEGLFMDKSQIKTWKSPFFTEDNMEMTGKLVSQHGAIYYIETAIYYNDDTTKDDQDVEQFFQRLSLSPELMFSKDLSYYGFLDRVRFEAEYLKSQGLWHVPHPWFHYLVPSSDMEEFNEKVFKGIFKKNTPLGVILVYPLNANKLDERMSLMFPKEEVFYNVALLLSTTPDTLQGMLDLIQDTVRFCEQNGMQVKQYIPDHVKMEDWIGHFGPKWNEIVALKMKYDPKAILATGQRIFTFPLA